MVLCSDWKFLRIHFIWAEGDHMEDWNRIDSITIIRAYLIPSFLFPDDWLQYIMNLISLITLIFQQVSKSLFNSANLWISLVKGSLFSHFPISNYFHGLWMCKSHYYMVSCYTAQSQCFWPRQGKLSQLEAKLPNPPPEQKACWRQKELQVSRRQHRLHQNNTENKTWP